MFKILLSTGLFIALFSLGFIIYLIILGRNSNDQKAPGLLNNQLTSCPKSPNCIVSEYSNDSEHYMEAWKTPYSLQVSQEKLKKIISDTGGIIIKEQSHYLAATYTSHLFRFVDDLEFRIDPEAQLIHFRSASRVGHHDLGVNKKRILQLKEYFSQ